MSTLSDLEIQKITETLKTFFPNTSIALTDDIKQAVEKLIPPQITCIKDLLSASQETQQKSDQLLQELESLSTTLTKLNKTCEELEKNMTAQLPDEVSQRYINNPLNPTA